MWTETATGLNQPDLPQSHRNFITANPRFAAHHAASAKRIASAMQRYAKTGIPDPNDICKVVIKMTSTCNLRCSHCFQWRETGHHHRLDPTAIPYDRCDHLFNFIERHPCDVILTGGEPTAHREFGKFVERLAQAGCFIYICTNGLLLKRHEAVLSRYHNQVAFLISLDGVQPLHDAVRGKGTYKKTMDAINRLAHAKRAGKQWIIGVESTLLAPNLGTAVDLIGECEAAGVDWMVFNHLWVVSLAARREYDVFCQPFGVVPQSYTGFDQGDFSDEYIDAVIATVAGIHSATTSIPVLKSTPYNDAELRRYYKGTMPAYPQYLKTGVKLDIDIGGKLVLTKQFPDVSFGSVLETPIEEIIVSSAYRQAAQQLLTRSLRVLNACPDAHNLVL